MIAAADRPLRILHTMRAPVGGLFRHVLDLTVEQIDRGHEVGIVADSRATNALTQQKLDAIAPRLALGLKLMPMRREPGLGDLAASLAVYHHAKALRLDVIHGHGAKGGAYARGAGALLKGAGQSVRVFYTPHGGTLHYLPGSAAYTIFVALERLMARVTDGMIFESSFAERGFVERIGEQGAKSRRIPNGLSDADFVTVTPLADAADFLFIGELRSLKGVDVLLHALASLSDLKARAVIVGAGPDEVAFKDLAQALHLQERVTFPGAMPAQTAFALGRILVVPSRAESFPYVVLEAGAAGLPVIASDVGGIPEMVAGTSNRLVPPGDADALARAMREKLADPAATAQAAAELKDAVSRRFTARAMADQVLDFYRSALATA